MAIKLTTSYQLIGSASKSWTRYRTYAKYNSQSIENNNSSVTIKMCDYATSSGVSMYPYSFQTTYCEGVSGSGTWYFSTSEEIIFERELTFSHQDDGCLSVSGTSSASGGDGSYDASYSWSFDLPTIPRASVPSMSPNAITVNGVNNTIISTNKKAAFSHKLEYVFGSITGVLGTDIVDSLTWTPPLSLLAQIPNAKSGIGTLKCTTYQTKEGVTTQIGSIQSIPFTLYVDGTIACPTISDLVLTEQDAKAAAVETAGSFIRYVSDILVTGTASPNCSSTLASVVLTCGTKSVTVGSTINASVVNVDDSSIKVTATDSRGYQTIKTASYALVPYVLLTVAAQANRDKPTNNKARLNYKGNFYSGSLGQVDNAFVAKSYKYKLSTDTTWTDGTTTLSPVASGTTYSQDALLADVFDYKKIYDVMITVEDKLMTVTQTVTLKKGIPVTHFGKDHFDVEGSLNVHNLEDPKNLTVGYAFSKEFIEKWKGIIGGGGNT